MSDSVSMWVIYDHPKDYPKNFVARRWVVAGTGVGKPCPTQDEKLADTLHELRESLRSQHPGLTVIPRDQGDDPVIVESWI